MPTYEYACPACGNAWEEIQKITEPPVEVCPACKKATAKRQISGGSFILKGGGWYSDLYASSPKPKSDSSEASSGKSEAKTETKSEGASKGGDSSSSSGGGSSGAGSAGSGGSGGSTSSGGTSGSTKAAE